MKPFQRMNANAIGGAAVISGDAQVSLLFVGASCQASLQPMTTDVDSVSLAVEKGKNAVVAIRARYNSGKGGLIFNQFLVGLSWKDDKLVVDMDKNFISPLGRLANLDESGNLQTLINGQRFVALREEAKKEDWISKGYRIIADPNLICKYLVEEATEADIEFASTEDKRSQQERELDGAKQLLNFKDKVIADYRSICAQKDMCISTLQFENKEVGAALAAAIDDNKRLRAFLLGDVAFLAENAGWGDRKSTLEKIVRNVNEILKPEKK